MRTPLSSSGRGGFHVTVILDEVIFVTVSEVGAADGAILMQKGNFISTRVEIQIYVYT